ncbi:Gpi1-domain-containing protein [Trametes cingulata]|nr:Gpi1-domain-containing protein [Trametes cingulata]
MHSTTILWPADLPPSEGICFGWTRPLLLVASIVPGRQNEGHAEELIAAAVAHPQWCAVRDMFSSDPRVIGYCDAPVSSKDSTPIFRLHDAPTSEHLDFQLVFYRRHKRQSMRFYAFDFTELDILPSQESTSRDAAPVSAARRNAEAVLFADFSRAHALAARKGGSLNEEVLRQANFAQFFAEIVESRRGAASSPIPRDVEPTVSRDRSTSRSPEDSGVHQRVSWFYILSAAVRRVQPIAREISSTADQLDVRFEQGVYVAGELPHVYHDKARTVTSISKYIKFHNCVWLVLNDVIIGVAFGTFLCENQHVLARILDEFLQQNLVHRMELALLWLNNWPAGLKLNTELSQFYCHSLIGVVSAWGWLLERAAPYFPALVWVIGAGGCCGMTMIISLLSDVLSVLTAHLYACYFISATVFRHQLSLAGSLWNLFRGKRYNVLRNRIDSWDYDLDQLLLGTILFTLVAFLYPTVLTYYALFAMARLAIMIIHAAFDTGTALLNHFPLFALLLRVKDPLRLPGGICVERSRAGPLILASQPAPLSSIFRHYAHLAGRLTTHYHPLRMLRQLASGRLMTPILRSAIRYNMIPVKTKASHPDKVS